LTAYEQSAAKVTKDTATPTVKPAASRPAPAPTKARKLSYREQQEWEGMEAAILAAEETLAARQAEGERAAGADHVALADACRALEQTQREVERLYARWQELESRRGS